MTDTELQNQDVNQILELYSNFRKTKTNRKSWTKPEKGKHLLTSDYSQKPCKQESRRVNYIKC